MPLASYSPADFGLYSDCFIVGRNGGEPGRLTHVGVTLLVSADGVGVGQAFGHLIVDDLDLRPVGGWEMVGLAGYRLAGLVAGARQVHQYCGEDARNLTGLP